MKAIVLAGGKSSRLYPATLACSKQILSVYDKPMIYYPISILIMLGIKDILIISTEKDEAIFKGLLKSGEQFGVNFSYMVQKIPRGIADAFIIAEKFINGEKVCLILGDNLFYGLDLKQTLESAASFKEGAVVFGYPVENPTAFGVVDFDEKGNVISIEEKPKNPKSNFAVPGLYFYDENVVEIAKRLIPSQRGELEITSVNEEYLKKNMLKVKLFSSDVKWLDTGTHKDLLKASNFVAKVQLEEGIYIACLEEIAYNNGLIDRENLLRSAEKYIKTEYGQHLFKLCKGENVVESKR